VESLAQHKPGKSRLSRKRELKNAWMPERVYFKKGRYVHVRSWKPYIEDYLCDGNSSKHEVWIAHERITQEGQDTLQSLVAAYLTSEEFSRLSVATKKHYTRLLKQASEWEMPRLKAPFGTLKLSEVGNKAIQSAYDQQEPSVARNRRFKILKIVFSWGMQRFVGLERNPVVGLKLMTEHPRDRYVTDGEYLCIYELASPSLQLMMEGAYLLRARRNELSRLCISRNVTEKGILIERSKHSWDGVVIWSDRLREWVKNCINHNARRNSDYLIHNRDGSPISKSGLDSMWRRVWVKASQSSPPVDHFTFHDLKAKGVTDHPHKEGGHKSAKMKAVYDRENRLELSTR
jgi:integrase